MANFKAKLDDRRWRRLVNTIEKNISDKTKLLKGVYLIHGFRDIVSHFRQEQGEDQKWQARSKNTNRRYERIRNTGNAPRGFRAGSFSANNKILQLTGNLRKSILTKTVRRRGTDRVAIISNVNYSRKHDEGSFSENLPKRDFMWLSSNAQERMLQTMLEFVLKGA